MVFSAKISRECEVLYFTLLCPGGLESRRLLRMQNKNDFVVVEIVVEILPNPIN
jgi:hypothetical protein